jgi:hypothetical protein
MVRRVNRSRAAAYVAMVAFPLALGVASYVVLRSWVPLVGAHAALWPTAPHLLRDHFADAMWGFALGAFVSLVWLDQKRAHRLAWVALAALAAAGIEFLQSTSIVRGVFDPVDLVVQTGSVLVAAMVIGGTKKWTWVSETR